MASNYNHLYKTNLYVPPSIIRKLEEVKPRNTEVFGEVNRFFKSDEAITGQSAMDRLLSFELRNKDTYRDMKNKIKFSLGSDIATHMSLNKL